MTRPRLGAARQRRPADRPRLHVPACASPPRPARACGRRLALRRRKAYTSFRAGRGAVRPWSPGAAWDFPCAYPPGSRDAIDLQTPVLPPRPSLDWLSSRVHGRGGHVGSPWRWSLGAGWKVPATPGGVEFPGFTGSLMPAVHLTGHAMRMPSRPSPAPRTRSLRNQNIPPLPGSPPDCRA